MEHWLSAYTLNEARYYLASTACAVCGKGPWQIPSPPPSVAAGADVVIAARCAVCGMTRNFTFRFDCASAEEGATIEQINPTHSPSRLLDVRQWLGMFYLLVEDASKDADKTQARLKGYRAALCLEEALKFYGDNELPPATAFFGEVSASAFHENPQRFARQRLRDMRSKLPSLNTMARNVTRDLQTGKPKWWQWWK